MNAITRTAVGLLVTVLVAGGSGALAENEGQDDLDKATQQKLVARNLADLGEVIRLCEDALKKGLDAENTQFANRLLASTLVQRGAHITRTLTSESRLDRGWEDYRRTALGDLERAAKLDPSLAEAYLRIGQLHLLPRGDMKRAAEALDKAVELSKDEAGMRAQSLGLRATIQTDPKKRLADLDEALRLAPKDVFSLRARAMFHVQQDNLKQALADLDASLKLDPEHDFTHRLKTMALIRLKQYPQAIAAIQRWQKFDKSASPLIELARTHMAMTDMKAALKDLDDATAQEPMNPNIALLKAGVYSEMKQEKKALEELDRIPKSYSRYNEVVRYRAMILAGMGKFSEAAGQLESFLKQRPDETDSRLQLAMLYSAEDRHRKAVAIYTDVLKKEADNFLALRGRGDALLGVGKHAEAVADYDKALKLRPKDSPLLNNFAWVLCTSPDDKVRNGKRALELATESCKLTEYKQGHILSTLAAAYAELGDFDSAKKWSQKAVELGRDDQKEALKKELENYQARKPVRELKTIDKSDEAPAAKTPPEAKKAAEEPKSKPGGAKGPALSPPSGPAQPKPPAKTRAD